MFGDCHAIIGYLIASCALEWVTIPGLDQHWLSIPIGSFVSYGPRHLSLTAKDVYLLFCAIIANSPDIDSVVTLLLRAEHHLFHRTWSHSYFGSLFFVPSLAIALHYLLSPLISFSHALIITFLCFYSHLVTDWITTYGIGLNWTPWSSSPFYALGVIIIFDFVTIAIWYASFMAKWYRLTSATAILTAFTILVSAWLFMKRIWLYKAFKRHVSIFKAFPPDNIWFQPSGFFPSKFAVFEFDRDTGVSLVTVVNGSQCPWPPNQTKFQAIVDAFFGHDLGYTRVAPREALIRSDSKRSVYRRWMMRNAIPSLILAAAHGVWFVLASTGLI